MIITVMHSIFIADMTPFWPRDPKTAAEQLARHQIDDWKARIEDYCPQSAFAPGYTLLFNVSVRPNFLGGIHRGPSVVQTDITTHCLDDARSLMDGVQEALSDTIWSQFVNEYRQPLIIPPTPIRT